MRIRTQEIEFSQEDLANLIRSRLTTATNVPRPLHRDEEPVDIFVDLADLDETWRNQLRVAVAKLLAEESTLKSQEPAQINLVGELCYLAARIGCTDARHSLQSLVTNESATGLLNDVEDLRLRALRALVGLLGAFAQTSSPTIRDSPESPTYRIPQEWAPFRDALISALKEPRLAVVALTGLIGLWPREKEAFLQMVVPADIPHGEFLDIGLRLAFPRRSRRDSGEDDRGKSRETKFKER